MPVDDLEGFNGYFAEDHAITMGLKDGEGVLVGLVALQEYRIQAAGGRFAASGELPAGCGASLMEQAPRWRCRPCFMVGII